MGVHIKLDEAVHVWEHIANVHPSADARSEGQHRLGCIGWWRCPACRAKRKKFRSHSRGQLCALGAQHVRKATHEVPSPGNARMAIVRRRGELKCPRAWLYFPMRLLLFENCRAGCLRIQILRTILVGDMEWALATSRIAGTWPSTQNLTSDTTRRTRSKAKPKKMNRTYRSVGVSPRP